MGTNTHPGPSGVADLSDCGKRFFRKEMCVLLGWGGGIALGKTSLFEPGTEVAFHEVAWAVPVLNKRSPYHRLDMDGSGFFFPSLFIFMGPHFC